MVHARDPRLHVRLFVLTPFVRFIPGALIVLFFKCMAALFNPVYRRGEGVKWGFVSYTMIMFSLVTVLIAMDLHIQSICYIDNREFPGGRGGLPPGPHGYMGFVFYEAIGVIPHAAFSLSNWLADGLLVSFLFDVIVALDP